MLKVKEWLEWSKNKDKYSKSNPRWGLLDNLINVTPIGGMPSGELFYIDIKYGDEKGQNK